ncbi:WAT1-related protein At4g30420-like [Cynara cardunculus var. scolymus]|uniref:WAT1-related protein At4g30420-like n=1 Tax=Cynara cardunculus var. scolymus TaxID=59895 RepID=UPI000D626C11|nr:WAT1-related protein At4g30420-like [Cynara cardunculus var. scolymus]
MGWFEHNKPLMVMLVLQFTYGAVSISTRASLLEGMNPRVFVVYRQAIATLAIAPISYFSRRKTTKCCIGWKSFSLIFIAALIGITSSQMLFLEGLYLASASAGSSMFNLVPAITFFVASIVGYEPVNIRSLRTIAKILGTVLCVTSAAAMALIKGPKLLNSQLPLSNSLLLNSSSGSDNLWLLGCLCLFGSSCCWSFYLIIQVPVNKNHPDHLSLSAWMCFTATVQSATVTWFTDPNLEVWKINSYLQLGSCLFAGIVGSGISLFVQSWVIERRGPVFSAMFNPLNTVIVTIMACIFLQERIYLGSVIGAVGIVIGLYVVLWGKAKDLEEQQKKMMISETDEIKIKIKTVGVLVDESKPLLHP